jgi:hypothetical protein
VLVVDLDAALLARSRATPEVPGLALRRLDLYPEDPFAPASSAPVSSAPASSVPD